MSISDTSEVALASVCCRHCSSSSASRYSVSRVFGPVEAFMMSFLGPPLGLSVRLDCSKHVDTPVSELLRIVGIVRVDVDCTGRDIIRNTACPQRSDQSRGPRDGGSAE